MHLEEYYLINGYRIIHWIWLDYGFVKKKVMMHLDIVILRMVQKEILYSKTTCAYLGALSIDSITLINVQYSSV